MTNRLKSRHSDRSWRKPDLRSGYTTSACAAACAAAGLKTLISGQAVFQLRIDLPGESQALFDMVRCEIGVNGVLCGTIKDAGDDPDITHGAEIQTFVSWKDSPGIHIRGGEGVGRVTRPGLPVRVGEAAINPGAQRLIRNAILAAGGDFLEVRGVDVEVRVPRGAELTQQTLNPRLGIVGGISILGTTGVLKPFSNDAYRAAISTELKVAKANRVGKVVLSTGSRSEQYAMHVYPELPELAFIQVGDHMDHALRQCYRLGLNSVVITGMIGKISKLAQGRMQTHVSQGGVDFQFLGSVASELGADRTLMDKIVEANTAHHVQVILKKNGIPGLEKKLACLAAQECFKYGRELAQLEVLMFDRDGELTAQNLVRRVQ